MRSYIFVSCLIYIVVFIKMQKKKKENYSIKQILVNVSNKDGLSFSFINGDTFDTFVFEGKRLPR